MYFKLILAAIVTTVIIFHQGFCLSCFNCYSINSWEDCDKHADKENCTEQLSGLETSCIKIVRAVVEKNNQTTWHYIKKCFETSNCNQGFCSKPTDPAEQMEKKAIGCDVYCCNDKDLCNGARDEALHVAMVTMTLSSITLVYLN